MYGIEENIDPDELKCHRSFPISNIILRRINDPCPQRIFSGFVNSIHFQFPENIFTVCSDGMNAGEAFGCDFLRGFTKSQQIKDFFFRDCQYVVMNIGNVPFAE